MNDRGSCSIERGDGMMWKLVVNQANKIGEYGSLRDLIDEINLTRDGCQIEVYLKIITQYRPVEAQKQSRTQYRLVESWIKTSVDSCSP